MDELARSSAFWGILITLGAYLIGVRVRSRTGRFWCNPLLIACAIVIVLLCCTDLTYDSYRQGAKYVSDLLTPATVCLALPVYRQREHLRRYWKVILVGCAVGVASSMVSILALSRLFALNLMQTVTLLPKSVTTTIGLGLSEEMGGIASITVASILITGLVGSLTAEPLCKWLRIDHPVAKGLAIGSSSHAIGTTKALELGETEGAISSLATVICGLITAAALPLIVLAV